MSARIMLALISQFCVIQFLFFMYGFKFGFVAVFFMESS